LLLALAQKEIQKMEINRRWYAVALCTLICSQSLPLVPATEAESKAALVQTSEGNAQTVLVPKGWNLADLGSGCAARLNGNEVDTMLSINDKDQVLLVAGRRDWSFSAGDVKLTLQFDSQPPRSFAAARWNNLVLLLLVDDKDVVALRKASSIKWHLPDGDYSAKLHDVGSALDAASACTKDKRIGVSR
jgi:hypothetical protein